MFSDDRKKTCEYCLLRFKYKHSSYPVSMKEIELLDTVDNKFTIVYKFDVDGIFCSLECALGYLELVWVWALRVGCCLLCMVISLWDLGG